MVREVRWTVLKVQRGILSGSVVQGGKTDFRESWGKRSQLLIKNWTRLALLPCSPWRVDLDGVPSHNVKQVQNTHVYLVQWLAADRHTLPVSASHIHQGQASRRFWTTPRRLAQFAYNLKKIHNRDRRNYLDSTAGSGRIEAHVSVAELQPKYRRGQKKVQSWKLVV
jgi:hypothetical protein